MNTITIKNLSTIIDCAAVGRVADLMAGDEYNATHNTDGVKILKITQRGNTYTVTNID